MKNPIKILVIAALTVALASCSELFSGGLSLEQRLQRVEEGMSFQQVSTIVDRGLMLSNMSGNSRTYSFTTSTQVEGVWYPNAEYFFNFVNDRLTSYHRERIEVRPPHVHKKE